MKQNRIEDGRFTEHGHGLGTVTEAMVRHRAAEIAVINGRSPEQVLSSDLAEARRELTGEERLVPSTPVAEALPEEDRWPGVPESEGKRAETVPAPDEQTFAEELVEEGVEEAEHDQALQAEREYRKRGGRP